MCIAIVKSKGINLPEKDMLKICFKNNPDGAGFAYWRDNKIYIHKGFFTFDGFYHSLIKANIKKEESALIHFRVATHGGISKHTCHPFLITNKYEDMKKTHIYTTNGDVLIHNGMLNFDLDEENISDSMYLTKLILNYDLSKEENRYMLNLALLNNNKSKMNRVAILRNNNTTEIYGFKEPWDIINGCYFSNKSYMASFTRGYNTVYYNTSANNEAEKKDYDENEIQSKKICFCHNHFTEIECDELGVYYVWKDSKTHDTYCEDCVDLIDYFYCEYCSHTIYSTEKSNVTNICKECFENNKEFILNDQCCICNAKSKQILFEHTFEKENIKYMLCNECFIAQEPFKCHECNHWFGKIDQSEIKNCCKLCFEKLSAYSKECTNCKSKNNLMRTNYTTTCKKCFNEKNGKRCFICDKYFMYGNESIGNLAICNSCHSSTYQKEIILNNFKSYKLLNEKIKKQLNELFEKSNDKQKAKVLELYKYNNYFNQMTTNAKVAYEIMNNK